MRVGYYNYHTKFTELHDKLRWDIFFRNTSEYVIMQFGTGNALRGGARQYVY